MSGENINNLVKEYNETENYPIKLNTGSLSRGVYYNRFNADNYTSVQK
jgi:hypothetical protein